MNGKQNVVYAYSGILFSLQNGRHSYICYTTWMIFEEIIQTEISQLHHKKANTIWFHWCEVPRVINSYRQKVEWWLPGGWRGGRTEELLFNGYRISIWEDGKCSRDEWWCWLHSSVNATEPVYLKMVKMITFMLSIFTTIKGAFLEMLSKYS